MRTRAQESETPDPPDPPDGTESPDALIEALAATGDAALRAQVLRWRDAVTSLSLQHASRRLGLDVPTPDALLAYWSAPPDPAHLALTPIECEALAHLERHALTGLPPRLLTFTLRRLAPLGLVARDATGTLVPLPGAWAAAAEHLPPRTSLFAHPAVTALPLEHRAALALALPQLPAALHALYPGRLQEDGRLDPAVPLPRLLRQALVLAAIAAAPPAPEALASCAAHLRAHALHLLEEDPCAPALDWLHDHPDPAPQPPDLRRASLRPALLGLEDAHLVERFGGPALRALPEGWSRRFSVLRAEGNAEANAWLAEVADLWETPLPETFLQALQSNAPRPPAFASVSATADAVLGHLADRAARARKPAPLAEALVGPLAMPPVAWWSALPLAQDSALEAHIDALLTPARFDFDTEGEGALPLRWAQLLLLAGRWDARWERRFVACADEADEFFDAASVGDRDSVLESLASTAAWQESRAAGDPVSSYAHGLNDGIAEAYGDVYSARDPFSLRSTEGS